MKNTKPFLLKPVGKDYLWGGKRINEFFSKGIELDPLAESWECSIHPDGLSTIVSGEYQGRTLKEVLDENPDFLGNNHKGETLPILIKLIDAKNNLSIQVHPDEEYAQNFENGSHGKTEMWYILDAEKDAKLVYGFNRDLDQNLFKESILDGTLESYLNEVPVKKGDTFFIPAGQVHAIGSGCLIAEIQQNSNLTYRIYDYNRVDKNGNLRELHIDKAVAVSNLKKSDNSFAKNEVIESKGIKTQLLAKCEIFEVTKMELNTECKELTSIQTTKDSFEVYLCAEGCGTFFFEDEYINFFKGDCIFVPSNSVEIKVHGKAELLKTVC